MPVVSRHKLESLMLADFAAWPAKTGLDLELEGGVSGVDFFQEALVAVLQDLDLAGVAQ